MKKMKTPYLKPITICFMAMLCLVSMSALVIPSYAASTTLKLTPVRGVIGTSVTITGKGYTANSMVTITGLFSKSCPTNSTGGIASCTVTVPNDPAGAYIVYSATGALGTSAKFTIGSKAHITLKPISGLPGSVVTVKGTHFGWNSKLTVTFNGVAVAASPSGVTTTSTGTFTLTFVVPNDAAKSYIVSVKDALGYTGNSVFTIT